MGRAHNVPSVSNLRLLTAEAWVQSQSIQCGSFVEQGDSGSPLVPSTSSPCASHRSTSEPSAVVLIIRNHYSRSFLLRNSSAYEQPGFRVNNFETSFCDCKSNVHSRAGHEGPERSRGIEVLLYSFFILCGRWELVVSTTLRPLYPREWPGTHSIGGWEDPTAGLDWCGKISHPPEFDPRTV